MKSKLKTFMGGVHPPAYKDETKDKPVKVLPVPQKVVLPMNMHIGAPCTPLVKKGDQVFLGQKIGDSDQFISVPIHASVSGTVKAVDKRLCINGSYAMAVEIESDGLDTVDPEIRPYGDYKNYRPEEIVEIIRNAGIIGMGGAAFPTHAKYKVPEGKKADVVILNGAECEPYLTADHHLMLAHPEKILQGLKIIMYTVGAEKGVIGIEMNKPDAVEALMKVIQPEDPIEIIPLKVKYPQGAEKQLINAITGRRVPSGGLPIDVGTIVSNVGTAAQITDTFETGMPLIKRYLTCAGDAVADPYTVEARVGTIVQDVIDQCGGLKTAPKKIISGGPMMGITLSDTDVPVAKGTSGIICLSQNRLPQLKRTNCIRCDRCVEVCPMHLQPFKYVQYVEKSKWDECKSAYIMDCIECGSCSYICPARQELVPAIRVAKSVIRSQGRKG